VVSCDDACLERGAERQHDGHSNKIALNDVVFAVHAVILTAITLGQIVAYDTGKHPVCVSACVFGLGPRFHITWLEHCVVCSYLALQSTAQVWHGSWWWYTLLYVGL
jgi:hypothetical protein